MLLMPREAMLRDFIARTGKRYGMAISCGAFVFDLRHGSYISDITIKDKRGSVTLSAKRLLIVIDFSQIAHFRLAIKKVRLDECRIEAALYDQIKSIMAVSSGKKIAVDFSELELSRATAHISGITVTGDAVMSARSITADVLVNGIRVQLAGNGLTNGVVKFSRIPWERLVPKNEFVSMLGGAALTEALPRGVITADVVYSNAMLGFRLRPVIISSPVDITIAASGTYDISRNQLMATAETIRGVPLTVSLQRNTDRWLIHAVLRDYVPLAVDRLGLNASVRGDVYLRSSEMPTLTLNVKNIIYKQERLLRPLTVRETTVFVTDGVITPVTVFAMYGEVPVRVTMPKTRIDTRIWNAAISVPRFDFSDIVVGGTNRVQQKPSSNLRLALKINCGQFNYYRLAVRDVALTLDIAAGYFALRDITGTLGLGTVSGEYEYAGADTPVHRLRLEARGVHVNHVVEALAGEEFVFATADIKVAGTFSFNTTAGFSSGSDIAVTASTGAGRMMRNRYLNEIYMKIGRTAPAFEYFDGMSLAGSLHGGIVDIAHIQIDGEDKACRIDGGSYDMRSNALTLRTNVFLFSETFRDNNLMNPLYITGVFKPAARDGWFQLLPFSYDRGAVRWSAP